MARIRTIKPDFFRHEELYQAEVESGLPLRVAFAGMFTVADREGRFRWKPKQIKIDVMPWDDLDFDTVLIELVDRGFIKKYMIDGKTYGWIPSFKDHQAINNKESKSTLPPYSLDADASFTRLSRDGNATLTEGKGREGKEHTKAVESLCSVFGKTYKAPEERMSAEVTFYNDIDVQANLLLEVHKPEELIKQVKAYLYHCKSTNRKLIGSSHKLAETILSCDWVNLTNPDARGPNENQFRDAEENKKLWTDEAWKKHYWHMKDNPSFKKHFNL